MEKIISFCKEVGDTLGKGLAECIYQEGICVLLRQNGMEYSKEVVIPITFKDVSIGNVRADIIIDDIIIECKAIDGNLKPSHLPQIIIYMKKLDYNEGIIVNFNQNPSKDMVEIAVIRKDASDLYSATLDNKVYYIKGNGILTDSA
jgi:GxxExxY protein